MQRGILPALALLAASALPVQASGLFWGGLQIGNGVGYSIGPGFGLGFGSGLGSGAGAGVAIGGSPGGGVYSGVVLGQEGSGWQVDSGPSARRAVQADAPAALPFWPSDDTPQSLHASTSAAPSAQASESCQRQAMNASGHNPDQVNRWTTAVMVNSYHEALQRCQSGSADR